MIGTEELVGGIRRDIKKNYVRNALSSVGKQHLVTWSSI